MHIDALLAQIAVILVASLLLRRVLRRLGQPAVIAEILAGIALGPSLLGRAAPGVMAALFPAASLEVLGTIAQLGLVFFMFLVGLEFDPRLLQGRARAAVAISAAGIAVPLVLGVGVAVLLPAGLEGAGASPLSFALFLGVAMSVTAFPVLARILTERRLVQTPVGALSLAAAAVDDVSAWSLLALVVGIASAAGTGAALGTVGLTLGYAALVWWGLRPLLGRLGPREGHAVSVELMSGAVLLVVLSALITEHIGIHALFGGFLIGAAMPRQAGLSTAITERMEDYVTLVLLPLFFAYSGLRTELGLLHSAEDWALTALLLGVATLGKFGGSALAARLTGLTWRESSAIGILMNTRGLMEIVVLNVGLDIGVISGRLFAMMVVVAVVTTWVTTPLLRRVYNPERADDAVPPPPHTDLPPSPPAGVMVCVADPRTAAPLVWLAQALTGPSEEPVWVVHLRPVERPHEYLQHDDTPSEPLEAVAQAARAVGLRYEAIAFSSPDPAVDLIELCNRHRVRVVLMGTHRSTFGAETLGGVNGALLRGCGATVAILLDRGLSQLTRVRLRPEGPSRDAVLALGEQLRRGGVALLGPQSAEPPDLEVQALAPEGGLPVQAEASVLVVRGGRG